MTSFRSRSYKVYLTSPDITVPRETKRRRLHGAQNDDSSVDEEAHRNATCSSASGDEEDHHNATCASADNLQVA